MQNYIGQYFIVNFIYLFFFLIIDDNCLSDSLIYLPHVTIVIRPFVSNFPHNFNCKESITIAKNNLQCIKKYSLGLGNKFETMLKGPVLYTENKGIFMFKDYKLNNNILEFKEIKSTINNELLKALNENKEFSIIDKNKIGLKDKVIDDIGFMLFI